MTLTRRHNVKIGPNGRQPMMFAHGFGCDQNMWRFIAPAFRNDYQTILFDHMGAGQSDLSAYHPARYSSLDGYVQDVLDIGRELQIKNGIFVGHSVSAMIGILAAIQEPSLFDRLILIGPSPCYINDGDYEGGFDREAIDELLETLDGNYLGWSSAMAPAIMGNADRPELAEELENSFCRMDPEIAQQFARVTFLSDNRKDLHRMGKKSLVLQCSEDVIAPLSVGYYLQRNLPGSELVIMKATGHCPNLSAPEETTAAMREFLTHS